MSDICDPSTPFAFDDLKEGKEEGSRLHKFVKLFPESQSPEQKETEEVSMEDRARQVFEDAYEQGEKAGFEMGMRRIDSIVKRLEKQVAQLASFESELKGRYEKLSTDLALIFAEAIILRECGHDREILGVMIRKALEACEEKSGIVIRVGAEDAKYIETFASENVRVVRDEMLKEPGFVIETKVGEIDGRIRTQIEELRAYLAGQHGE